MKPHNANLLNAVMLIAMGAWGYFSNDSRPPTALIPVFFGIVLLVLTNSIRYDNKVVAHIAVVLTLLVLVALFKPFLGQVDKGDTLGMVRAGAMIVTSAIAMITFIRSFIAARKNKA